MFQVKFLRIFLCCFLYAPLIGFTSHHFYRASFLPDEPRIETPFLSSFKTRLIAGSTCSSFDCRGCKAPLFAADPCIQQALLLTCCTPCFAQRRQLHGYFDMFEADINFWQNFCAGFFLELNIPYLQTELFAPETPQTLTIDSRFSCAQQLYQKHGLGDIALLFGFARNYQETEFLDFIDGSVEIGVLFPTGKIKNPFIPFDFSYGYGGHYGIPVVVDVSVAVYDWLTCGFHIDSVFLLGKKHRLTPSLQSSSMPPNREWHPCNYRWGNITCGSAYVKADHVFQGLTFAFGFSHARKNNFEPKLCIDPRVMRCTSDDLALRRWSMTTFHFFLEYDLSQPDSCIGPRVAFIYNKPIRGKRIWRTTTKGGDITVDVAWEF